MRKWLALLTLLVTAGTLWPALHDSGADAATRNRQPTGFRGRLASALVGRQSSSSEPVWGIGRDWQANVVNQSDIPLIPVSGRPGYYRRIPLLCEANNGDWLLFTDCRSTSSDDTGYAIAMNRSTDRGRTWSTYQTIYSHATFTAGSDWIAAGSVVVDRLNTGAITYHFIQSSTTVHKQYITRSTDHGATWSAPTEITSTVKVTGVGAPVGHTYNGTPWTWCAPGCSPGIQLTKGPNAGRLLVPYDHRFISLATSNPSYSHLIKSDDGGATWSLHGGLSEIAANEFSNEWGLTETATLGKLCGHIRRTAGATTRMQSVSLDYGATWSNQAAIPALIGSDTAGDIKQLGGFLVASYSSDPAATNRVGLSMAISRDDGTTWAAADTRLLSGRPAGYSGLMVVGSDVVCVFERGQGNRGASSIPEWAQAVQVIKTNKSWLLNPTPRYSEWSFNEEGVFVVGRTLGGEIPDYGNLDERAVCQTLAVPPTYQANGIALTSAADHVILSPATDPAFEASTGQSLTLEMEAEIAPGQNGALFSKMVGTTGYQLECLAGVLKLTVGDGTNTPTITGTTTVNDGVRRTYAFVRDKTRGKLGIYVNGQLDAAEVNDTTVNASQTGSGLLAGMKTGSTLHIDMLMHWARATRGVVTNLRQPGLSKKTLPDLRRYTLPTVTAGPTSINNLSLWTHQTWNQGLDAFADINLTERYQIPPPIGAGMRSFKDGSGTRRHYRTSEFRRWKYFSDPKMGPCWDAEYISASVPGYMQDVLAYGATNGFDFIQNTCTFAIAGCVKFNASTGTVQTIAGNNQATGGNAGFFIWRPNGAASKLSIHVSTGPSGGSVNRINENIAAAPAISYGSTYFFCFVGRGIGSKVDLYIAPITADYNAGSPTAPTVTKYQSSANMAAVGGAPFTTLSTDVLTVGASNDTLYGMNGYLKNFVIYSAALTDAEVQSLATFCVSF